VSLPSSDITQLVRRSASQPSVVGRPSDESARMQTDVMTEESLDLMEQDEDSLDSEEDGLRQLLLLQQTKYWLFFCIVGTEPCHSSGDKMITVFTVARK